MHDGRRMQDLQQTGEAEDRGFRRRVFYIPGFDPIPPRRYRELYRREAARQAGLSGYELTFEPWRSEGPNGWKAGIRAAEGVSQADIEVLYWADIVRQSMGHSIAATYWQMLRTGWVYIGSGALFGLMRLRGGPVIAAFYPVAVLLGQLLVALLGGGLAGWLALSGVPGLAGRGVAVVAAVVVAVLVLRRFRAADGWFYAYYLMHDYAFAARDRGAYPAQLETRLQEFSARIRSALDAGYDEVLVVGHSSGAYLAISVLADLIRSGLPAKRPELALLTLGQVVPMVSYLPRARRLRGDLRCLAASSELTWVDVSAPGDGCAFALCDPVRVSGVAPANQLWPRVFSAAFSQTLRPETWRRDRRRFFRLHFQYLCAFDNLPGEPWDYDYFQVTAGAQTLAARFAGRPRTRSLIDRAANRYTTVV